MAFGTVTMATAFYKKALKHFPLRGGHAYCLFVVSYIAFGTVTMATAFYKKALKHFPLRGGHAYCLFVVSYSSFILDSII
jgi:hypothetical protein